MESTSGEKISRVWDPNKVYDAAPVEQRAIQERAHIREQLKKEYQMKITNPYRGVGGYVFDPTVQRYLSMKANYYSRFKRTPSNFLYFLGTFVGPVLLMDYLIHKETGSYDQSCRNGEIAYADRKAKLV